MKGFEVRARGKIIEIAVNEPISMGIYIQKVRGKINLMVSAWLIEVDKYVAWEGLDNLEVGDEIIIKRKKIDRSTPPLAPPPGFDPAYRSPEDIAAMWRVEKQRFLLLEKKLKEEGLI
jgi:hypothetical protein